jgi:hypothetical protein
VVTIDAFTDEFPAEPFITAWSGNPAVITEISQEAGLEVGKLRLPVSPNNDEVGELYPPSSTIRTVETRTQTGLPGVLGGQRTGTLTWTYNVTPTNTSRAVAGYGDIFLACGPSAQSKLLLEYGDESPLNADFSSVESGGYFILNNWSLDQGTVTATLSLTSGSTTQSKSITLNDDDYEDYVDYTITFSDFSLINFSDVDVISLELVSNTSSQDWDLYGAFEATPEPATMALLALGGIGMLLRRKR